MTSQFPLPYTIHVASSSISLRYSSFTGSLLSPRLFVDTAYSLHIILRDLYNNPIRSRTLLLASRPIAITRVQAWMNDVSLEAFPFTIDANTVLCQWVFRSSVTRSVESDTEGLSFLRIQVDDVTVFTKHLFFHRHATWDDQLCYTSPLSFIVS